MITFNICVFYTSLSRNYSQSCILW